MRIPILLLCAGLAACATRHPVVSEAPPPAQFAKTPTLRVADAALAGGAPGIALQVSREILARQPRNAEALVREGDALFALDRAPEAANSYRRALDVDSGSIAAKLGLGRARLRNDPAGAEAMFLQILAADSSSAAALNDLGVARDLQGHHAAAQEAYARAAATAPDMTAAQVNLGLSLALSGNGGRALDILRPLAAGSEATPRIRQDLAVALVMAGDERKAQQVLRTDLSDGQIADALSGYQRLRDSQATVRN